MAIGMTQKKHKHLKNKVLQKKHTLALKWTNKKKQTKTIKKKKEGVREAKNPLFLFFKLLSTHKNQQNRNITRRHAANP